MSRVCALFLIVSLLTGNYVSAQDGDTAHSNTQNTLRIAKPCSFALKQTIVPVLFITYGVATLFPGPLHEFNYTTREDIYGPGGHSKIPLDDVSFALPALSVYALHIAGLPGKNCLLDETLVLGIASLAGNGVSQVLKRTVHEYRPDGSDDLSFPSSHTLNAFVGAAFLMEEYKDRSIWIGIAGYAVAAGTGYLRIYNDDHWLGDVVTGAGIGILSTQFAYWAYPAIKRVLFHSSTGHTLILPSFRDGYCGASLVHSF